MEFCKKCNRQCTCNLKCILQVWTTNKLVFLTLLGALIGVMAGTIIRQYDLPGDLKVWIKIWGELFMRMLEMSILPLIMCSMIIGISSMDIRSCGQLGLVTLVYHISINFFSIMLGIIIYSIMQPGRYWLDGKSNNINVTLSNNGTYSDLPNAAEKINYSDIFADFLRNLFPDNIIRACLENVYTERMYINESGNGTNNTYSTAKLVYRDGTNTMGIITFSLVIGVAMSVAKEESQPLRNVVGSLLKIMFFVLKVIIWLSPFAIISLVMSAVIEIQDISSVISAIGMYVLTFCVCSAVHMFGLVPLLYFIIVRKNPYSFWFRYVSAGVLAGFGPATSGVGVPVIMETYQKNKCVDQRVCDFFLPLAISVSRSGSAMFLMYTLLFVAQTYPAGISVANIVVAILLITILASTVPSVPSSSIMLLLTLSQAVNVNVGDRIAVIMAMEWLLDRLRGCNNISSSGLGCAIVDKLCINNLDKRDQILDLENCDDILLADNIV